MPLDNRQSDLEQGSLTTDPDRFSDEAWDLLIGAQDSARRWRHQNLDVEHLMQTLLQKGPIAN